MIVDFKNHKYKGFYLREDKKKLWREGVWDVSSHTGQHKQ